VGLRPAITTLSTRSGGPDPPPAHGATWRDFVRFSVRFSSLADGRCGQGSAAHGARNGHVE
jgi:hypothetical protein